MKERLRHTAESWTELRAAALRRSRAALHGALYEPHLDVAFVCLSFASSAASCGGRTIGSRPRERILFITHGQSNLLADRYGRTVRGGDYRRTDSAAVGPPNAFEFE